MTMISGWILAISAAIESINEVTHAYEWLEVDPAINEQIIFNSNQSIVFSVFVRRKNTLV